MPSLSASPQMSLELETEAGEELCTVCSEPESDCQCVTCDSCDNRVEFVCSNCDHCTEGCCSCSHCSCCNEPCEYTCSTCYRCDDHCECLYCEGCSESIDTDRTVWCGDCDHCENCCDCSDNSANLIDGYLRFHKAQRNQYKRNPSHRFVSLEVEVASGDGSAVHRTARTWGDAIVEDGSLPVSGWELNMNPAQGDLFIDHCEEIGRALSSADARVNSACGMHCHVDASDFGWFDLFKLCRLYSRIEDGLFSLVSASRANNHYCAKSAHDYTFSDYRTFKGDLTRRLYGWEGGKAHKRNCGVTPSSKKAHKHSRSKNIFHERTEKYNSARYHALNLHSFFFRGTVEFRHHQGTTNAGKMMHWGMICASILDSASRMTMGEIDALTLDGFSNLLTILRPDLQAWALTRISELTERK